MKEGRTFKCKKYVVFAAVLVSCRVFDVANVLWALQLKTNVEHIAEGVCKLGIK